MSNVEIETSALESNGSALTEARAVCERLTSRARAVVVGRDRVIDLVVIALLADGHVLLEDYPGSGKTTLARCLGESLQETRAGGPIAAFRRIQFTPDLLPSDVTGSSIFDMEHNRFRFNPGPIFAHIVLADEINRTSPKVQAAMLEAMAEKQVTVDNGTHPLDPLFFVIATQNPLDVAGTYPLPTPQLDRFLFKIQMTHIDRESELAVLEHYPKASLDMAAGIAQVSQEELLRARAHIRAGVHIAQPIRDALVDFARSLRADERVLQGASTRSLVLALPALQTSALMQGRDYVGPEDLQRLAEPIFSHRIECSAGIGDVPDVIQGHLAPILERLARASLSA